MLYILRSTKLCIELFFLFFLHIKPIYLRVFVSQAMLAPARRNATGHFVYIYVLCISLAAYKQIFTVGWFADRLQLQVLRSYVALSVYDAQTT